MTISNPQHSVLSTQSSKPQRLGLLGGSFNPIHNCHLSIAHQVHEALGLSCVLFIPSGDPPHKHDASLASADARFTMVQLATAGIAYFEVSDLELRRKGKSYSVDTVQELQQRYGPATELFFIIGLDAFLDFPTWKAPELVLTICHMVVISRPGRSFQDLMNLTLLPQLDAKALGELDSRTSTSLKIPIPSTPGITCLSLPPCPTSASEIRRRIRSGATLANMLPPPVESYILQKNLYQEDCDRTYI